jgi:uncharacterized membrane protein
MKFYFYFSYQHQNLSSECVSVTDISVMLAMRFNLLLMKKMLGIGMVIGHMLNDRSIFFSGDLLLLTVI